MPISNQPIIRWTDGQFHETTDDLAEEEPLEIRVRGRAVSITMRTSGHDDELAAGFLLTEGVIHQAADILKIEPCDRNEDGNVLNVLLAPDVFVDFARLTRHVFASSSCGICGKTSIDSIRATCPSIPNDSALKIDPAVLARLPDLMRKAQETFDRTGGLHAAALFDFNGELRVLREDIGRHNAVDKVIGQSLLQGFTPLNQCILLVSGRSSFEIMQKALVGGIPIIASVSAPSSLAVEFAKESGQTLVGFLREGRMNVYAHADRIRF